jgi:DNA-binding response OmpR family regulator
VSGTRRVLFVDDDTAAREGYAVYLTRCGYDVMPASTGLVALALAKTWEPDVIVLDLALPDIDGWEVARQLKGMSETHGIPIIAFTGTGAHLPNERASAMRAGCDRYLVKPCDPAEVVAAIQRCVEATSS